MVTCHRRTFLCAFSAAIVSISGCLSDSSASAGSLVFENRHDLPHVVRLDHITFSPDDGTRIGEEQGEASLEPAETKRYVDVLDPSLGHEIVGTLPGSETIRVPYGREGTETADNLVFFEITESGSLNGGVRSVRS